MGCCQAAELKTARRVLRECRKCGGLSMSRSRRPCRDRRRPQSRSKRLRALLEADQSRRNGLADRRRDLCDSPVEEHHAERLDEKRPTAAAGEWCKSTISWVVGRTAAVEEWRSSLSPLVRAAEMGDADAVTRLLESGADPNESDESGWSALHAAAVRDHPAVVAKLLAAGAAVDSRDQAGFTPLLNAAAAGPAVIEQLLSAGADPRLRTSGSGGARSIVSPSTPTSRRSNWFSLRAHERTYPPAPRWVTRPRPAARPRSRCCSTPAPTPLDLGRTVRGRAGRKARPHRAGPQADASRRGPLTRTTGNADHRQSGHTAPAISALCNWTYALSKAVRSSGVGVESLITGAPQLVDVLWEVVHRRQPPVTLGRRSVRTEGDVGPFHNGRGSVSADRPQRRRRVPRVLAA